MEKNWPWSPHDLVVPIAGFKSSQIYRVNLPNTEAFHPYWIIYITCQFIPGISIYNTAYLRRYLWLPEKRSIRTITGMHVQYLLPATVNFIPTHRVITQSGKIPLTCNAPIFWLGLEHSNWWFQPPLKNMSKWESSPNRGANKRYLKLPPRHSTVLVHFFEKPCLWNSIFKSTQLIVNLLEVSRIAWLKKPLKGPNFSRFIVSWHLISEDTDRKTWEYCLPGLTAQEAHTKPPCMVEYVKWKDTWKNSRIQTETKTTNRNGKIPLPSELHLSYCPGILCYCHAWQLHDKAAHWRSQIQ